MLFRSVSNGNGNAATANTGGGGGGGGTTSNTARTGGAGGSGIVIIRVPIPDAVAPTVTVSGPANGSTYRGANVPSVAGTIADETDGSGVAASNGTTTYATGQASTGAITFTLQRASDSQYWNGTTWAAGATSFGATSTIISGGAPATAWTASWTAPTWTSLASGSYTIAVTGKDQRGNAGTASTTFTLDNTAPTLAFTMPVSASTSYQSTTEIGRAHV